MEAPLALYGLREAIFPGPPLTLFVTSPISVQILSECAMEGRQVGFVMEGHRVGTAARIDRVVEVAPGLLGAFAVTTCRFRVLYEIQVEPYPQVIAELDEEAGDGVPENTRYKAESALRRYLSNRLPGYDAASLPVPDSPLALSYELATCLGTSASVKQVILEAPTVTARLTIATAMMLAECGFEETGLRKLPVARSKFGAN